MSNITNEDLQQSITAATNKMDKVTNDLSTIKVVVYGPDGKPEEGLIMRQRESERIIKLQMKLGWIILTAVIIAGATNFMNKVQIVW